MTIKNLLGHKTIWLVLAIFWTALVLYLCLISSEELPSINLKIEGTDKGVHFIFHFMFTLFWIIYFSSAKNINDKSLKSLVQIIIFSSFVFGVLIELIQEFFTDSRSGDIKDVFFNILGALTAGILLYFIPNRINKLKT